MSEVLCSGCRPPDDVVELAADAEGPAARLVGVTADVAERDAGAAHRLGHGRHSVNDGPVHPPHSFEADVSQALLQTHGATLNPSYVGVSAANGW